MDAAIHPKPRHDRRSSRLLWLCGGLALAALALGLSGLDRSALQLSSTDRSAADRSETAGIQPSGSSPASRRLYGFYPAEVLRVIDGDTVEMRVAIWLGQDVTTQVRMRGIDAPELRARCGEERTRAEAAKTRLEALLKTGALYLTDVGYDKYGTRVVARIVDATSADLGATLVSEGLARPYAGGKRAGWCEGAVK